MGTYIFLHISSRYAKIFGETNFRTREIPRSGSKAEDGGEERERERLNNGENNGQATHGARKHAWRTQAAWANILKLTLLAVDYSFVCMSVLSSSLCILSTGNFRTMLQTRPPLALNTITIL